MVRSVDSARGEVSDLQIQAEIRREQGLDPVFSDPDTSGVCLMTGSRCREVVNPIVEGRNEAPRMLRAHRPNRNQVFPAGSLSLQEEARLSMGSDLLRYTT